MRLPRLLAALAVALPACGGSGGPSAPGPVAAPDPRVPAGATLRFLRGDTGQPLDGARIVAAGRSYTTGPDGTATLGEAVAPGALLDVVEPRILDRQTTFRTGQDTVFRLWPRTSAGGLDEAFTATLAYTATAEGAVTGGAPLRRLRRGASVAVVVPSAELLADPEAMATHERAVAAANEALGGLVRLTLSATRPASGVVVDALVAPNDPGCVERTRALTRIDQQFLEIVGAHVIYCSPEAARSSTVLHEIGHALGLYHSADAREVMHGFFSSRRADRFGEREALVLRMVLDRRAGNRFPDNDRDVTGLGGTGRVEIACGG